MSSCCYATYQSKHPVRFMILWLYWLIYGYRCILKTSFEGTLMTVARALSSPHSGPPPTFPTSTPCVQCFNGTCYNTTCSGSGSEPNNSSLSCGGYECQNGGYCDYSSTCSCPPYYAGPDCSELRGKHMATASLCSLHAHIYISTFH